MSAPPAKGQAHQDRITFDIRIAPRHVFAEQS
jgi:hypothetical protein